MIICKNIFIQKNKLLLKNMLTYIFLENKIKLHICMCCYPAEIRLTISKSRVSCLKYA